MKRGLALVVGLGMVLWLSAGLFSPVQAQESDLVLQSYSLATESLDSSVLALTAGDSVVANEELQRALDSLRVLSDQTSSGAIVRALESTFEQAQSAVQNRSDTDLAVQVAVIEGGFWRLVYEAALGAANDGDMAIARERLARIGADMGFSEARLAALDPATSPLVLLTSFEQGVVDVVRERLTTASEQIDLVENTVNQQEAYRAMAGAYGRFLPVQDSPRTTGSANALFSSAFGAIVDNNGQALSTSIAALSTEVIQFAEAAASTAASGIEVTLSPTAEVAPVEPAVVDTVVTETVADTNTPVVTDSVAAPVVTVADPAVTDTAPTNPETATTDSTTAVVTPAVAPVVAVGPQLDVAALTQQLSRFGLPLARQQRLAEAYLDEGYGNVNDVLNVLYAESARAIAAVEVGDQARARGLLSEFETTYATYMEPIIGERNASFNASTLNLINTLQRSPSLRLQDAVVLTGHVEEISSVLSDNQTAGLHQAIVATTNIWSGWVRLAVVMLLGILAFVPLYLLYLAFGGGNRNWQLIGWALFLLLLPLIYEGFSYFTGLLSTLLGGISWLEAPAQFSFFQNTISQLLWVLLTGLAIALATAGLYGICVQFGLLGRRTTSVKATNALDTAVGNTAVSTSFDWDEEF